MKLGVGLLGFAVATLAPGVSATAASGVLGASGISLSATGEVLYDSNQLRSGIVSGGHSDDFRYSPSGSIGYSHMLGRGSIVLNGTVGHDFFQYNKYLDRNRFGAGGTLSARAGASCTASVNGNYSNRQNGIGEVGPSETLQPTTGDLPPDDIGRLIDNRQIYVNYGVNATCGSPGGRLSFGGGASHSSLDNGSSLRRFLNSNSDVYSIFAGLGVFRPGQLQVNGSYSTINYPNQLVLPGATMSPVGLDTGVKTYSVGLTYSRPLGTKLSGSIGGSYLTARPQGGQAPYSAPAYNLSLTYRPRPRLSLSALGSRSILSSSTSGALFRVVDSVQVSGSYTVNDAVTANANAGLTSNSFKLPFAIPGEVARNTDTSKSVGGGVTYSPRSRYRLALYVSQTFRTSSASVYNYNGTRASVTLSVHI